MFAGAFFVWAGGMDDMTAGDKYLFSRDASLLPNSGRRIYVAKTSLGETGFEPVPKEQPPPETLRQKDQQGADRTLESGVHAPAEGITISGDKDRGGS